MAEPIGTRTLRELTRIIFARYIMVILIIAIITGGTVYVCLKVPKHYSSSVTFLVKEPRPQNPTAQQVSPDRSLQVFIKTQHEIIKSHTVLARTMALFLEPKSEETEKWNKAREAWLTDSTEQNWREFMQALRALDVKVEQMRTDDEKGEMFRDEVRRFAARIDVETPGGAEVTLSEIFTVTVTWPGPPILAQHVTDYLSKSYIDRYREVQAHSSRNAVELMRTRLAQLKQQRLQEAESNLRNFVVKELVSPADLVILEQLLRSGTEAGESKGCQTGRAGAVRRR